MGIIYFICLSKKINFYKFIFIKIIFRSLNKKMPTKENQQMIWIIVGVVVVIAIAVVVYFIMKNKKENFYFEEDFEEDYEENYIDNEIIENYLIDNYVAEYIEDYELLNAGNPHVENMVANEFNKIQHVACLISRESDLEIIRREAERIGVNVELIHRILKDEHSAHKFYIKLFQSLEKHHNNIGKVINEIAHESLVDIKNVVSPKVENYQADDDDDDDVTPTFHPTFHPTKKPRKLLKHKLKHIDKCIHRLKKCLHEHHHKGHSHNVTKAAKKAKVDKETFQLLVNNRCEAERFIRGETTLENYNPDFYVENYGITDTLANLGSVIKSKADKAAAALQTIAEKIGTKVSSTTKAIIKTLGPKFTELKANISKGYDTALSKIQSGYTVITDKIKSINIADVWAKIKAFFLDAKDKLIDFIVERFDKLLGNYIKCKTCPEQDKFDIETCPNGPGGKPIIQINDGKLSSFLLDTIRGIISNLLVIGTGPAGALAVLIASAPVISDLLNELVEQLWDDYVWENVRNFINDNMIKPLIEKLKPGLKYDLELAEWFKIQEMIENFEDNAEVIGQDILNKERNTIRNLSESMRRREGGEYRHMLGANGHGLPPAHLGNGPVARLGANGHVLPHHLRNNVEHRLGSNDHVLPHHLRNNVEHRLGANNHVLPHHLRNSVAHLGANNHVLPHHLRNSVAHLGSNGHGIRHNLGNDREAVHVFPKLGNMEGNFINNAMERRANTENFCL